MYVALLRGVNVGGRHKLPMKALAELFGAAGCREVTTYIQSGNVWFDAPAPLAKKVPALLETAIGEHFGFRPAITVRTVDELGQIARANPFLRQGVDPKALHVGFLCAAPSETQVARLDPEYSAPDEFRVVGREVYMFFPDGLGGSRLAASYFDRHLETPCTVRNWNTVQKLARL